MADLLCCIFMLSVNVSRSEYILDIHGMQLKSILSVQAMEFRFLFYFDFKHWFFSKNVRVRLYANKISLFLLLERLGQLTKLFCKLFHFSDTVCRRKSEYFYTKTTFYVDAIIITTCGKTLEFKTFQNKHGSRSKRSQFDINCNYFDYRTCQLALCRKFNPLNGLAAWLCFYMY
jgi:hypothetical protein